MTEAEMIDFFTRYPYKQDALAILARKTGMDKEAVRGILNAAGVDWTDHKKPQRKKRVTKRKKEAAETMRVFRYIFGDILPGVEPL